MPEAKSFMQQKMYLNDVRDFISRKNQAGKSKTIFNLCIRKLQRYPKTIQRYFFKCCAKIHVERKCLRKNFLDETDENFLSVGVEGLSISSSILLLSFSLWCRTDYSWLFILLIDKVYSCKSYGEQTASRRNHSSLYEPHVSPSTTFTSSFT